MIPVLYLSCLPSSSTSDNSQNQRSSLKHPQFSSTPSRPSRQNNAAQLQKDKKINTINPPLDLTSEDQVYEHIATINKNEIAKYKSVPAIRDRIQELQVELQKSKYSVTRISSRTPSPIPINNSCKFSNSKHSKIKMGQNQSNPKNSRLTRELVEHQRRVDLLVLLKVKLQELLSRNKFDNNICNFSTKSINSSSSISSYTSNNFLKIPSHSSNKFSQNVYSESDQYLPISVKNSLTRGSSRRSSIATTQSMNDLQRIPSTADENVMTSSTSSINSITSILTSKAIRDRDLKYALREIEPKKFRGQMRIDNGHDFRVQKYSLGAGKDQFGYCEVCQLPCVFKGVTEIFTLFTFSFIHSQKRTSSWLHTPKPQAKPPSTNQSSHKDKSV